jgi:hypothetical protein
MQQVSKSLHIDQESYHLLVESVRDYAIFMIDEHGIMPSL